MVLTRAALPAALVLAASACRTQEVATPAASVPPAIATFTGEVDLGTRTLRLVPQGGDRPGALVVPIDVFQDGVPGSGPPDTVELVTESAGEVAGGCGAFPAFEGSIRMRSFFAGAVLANAHVELLTVTPAGHEACNSSPPIPGTSDQLGLFDYGALSRAGVTGDGASAIWRFTMSDQSHFTFTGRVVADIVTADPSPPISSAAPGGGTVGPGTQVTLTCVDVDTGCAAIHVTTDGSPPTLASPLYSGPIGLAGDTTLRWFAVDRFGNEEAPRSASYVVDATAPWVVATAPADGATGVPESVTSSVTFSEAMDTAATAAALSLTGPAGAVAGTVTWSAGGDVFTFSPSAPLSRGASYTLAVAASARDVRGNTVGSPASAAFSTRPAEDVVSGHGSATLDPGGIAFDGAGNGLAAWRTSGGKVVYACYAAGGTWSATATLDHRAVSQPPRVSAGASGFAVAWFGSGGVSVSVFSGCTPGTTTVLATGFYGYALGIGSNGTGFAVAWAGTSSGSYASVFDGSVWGTTRYFTSATYVSGIRLAGEGTGYRLVYTNAGSAYAVQYTGTWSAPTSLGYALGGSQPAIASASGLTCIVWTDGTWINARREAGGQVTTTALTWVTGYGGLDVATDGVRCEVVIASDAGARGFLHDGAAWQAVASFGTSGAATAVGVLPHGGTEFAAFALQGGDLWLNRTQGGAWGSAILAESGTEPVRLPVLAARSASEAQVLFAQADDAADRVWTVSYDGSAASAPGLRSDVIVAGGAAAPQLAVTAGGDALAIWTQEHRGRQNVFWALNQAGTWSTPQLLATDAWANAVASNGTDFMVAYTSGSGSAATLVAQRWSGGGFSAPVTVSSGYGAATAVGLSSDGAGYAIGYVVYASISSGYQPVARLFDGTSWLAPKWLAASGSKTTSGALAVAGHAGEYLFAWVNQAGSVSSAMSWRATGGGASWAWEASSRTIVASTVGNIITLAPGPGGFAVVYATSAYPATLDAAIMTSGAWSTPATLRSGSYSGAVASDGAGYFVASYMDGSAAQGHAWNGAWQAARDLGFRASFSVSAASDGSGYAVLADGSASSQLAFLSVPEPIAGTIAAPLLINTATLGSTSTHGFPLAATPLGYLAVWPQRDPLDASVTRIYARGGL